MSGYFLPISHTATSQHIKNRYNAMYSFSLHIHDMAEKLNILDLGSSVDLEDASQVLANAG